MPADPQQLTPWFDGSVKPTRVGWYQRDYEDEDDLGIYTESPDYWDGMYWRVGIGKHKPPCDLEISVGQDCLRWRGLTKEQK